MTLRTPVEEDCERDEMWITTGWGRGPNGELIELGRDDRVKCDPPPVEPEIPYRDLGAYLKFLEAHQ